MPTLRRHRFFTVLFALCSLLFMQLAVAGYSCPGLESRMHETASMVQAGMPCAESMSTARDDAQPNLCKAHCEPVQAGADQGAVQVPPLVADGGLLVVGPVALALPQLRSAGVVAGAGHGVAAGHPQLLLSPLTS